MAQSKIPPSVRALQSALDKVESGELRNLIVIEYRSKTGATVLGRYGTSRITTLISLLEKAKDWIKNEHHLAHRPS